MLRKGRIRVLGAMALSIAVGSSAMGQAPAPPTPTLWSFLGIPQATKHFQDTVPNHFGKHPGLEKKPPLKPLAAAENLKSEVPAIKKAAEVKQAEDMKAQKIKAVKYLASIGCGCYNRDGSITDALIAALDDCTEEVRYETVLAILGAAKGNKCATCSEKSCCSKALTKKLSDMAYERNDEGCYLEPSARIREAAVKALCTCCPGNRPPVQEYLAPIVQPDPEDPVIREKGRAPREGSDNSAPEPMPESVPTPAPAPLKSAQIITPSEAEAQKTSPLQPVVKEAVVKASNAKTASKPVSYINRGPLMKVSHVDDTTPDAPVVEYNRETDPLASRIIKALDAPSIVPTKGSIQRIDRENGMVEIRFDNRGELPVGHAMDVYHDFALTGKQIVGHLEVVRTSPGMAYAKPMFGSSMSKFATGDAIRISHKH